MLFANPMSIADEAAEAGDGGMVVLRDDALMRLWRREGQGDRLVVCCSGVGRVDSQPPNPEFNRLGYWDKPDHLLFFADPNRTWLNTAGLIEALVAAIEAEVIRTQAKTVCIVGHSMGAYAAMVLPAFTRVDVAVAFSPQYMVDPALVPTETRWPEWRLNIPAFRIASVADHLQPECQYFVFHGRNKRESVQRDLVKPLVNLDMFVIPGTYHKTPKRLKEAGIFDQVLAACFDNRRQDVRDLMQKTVAAELHAVPTEHGVPDTPSHKVD
ncbi:MAG: alpha/beta fold hydrolase [Cypionkella sp.]